MTGPACQLFQDYVLGATLSGLRYVSRSVSWDLKIITFEKVSPFLPLYLHNALVCFNYFFAFRSCVTPTD